MTSEPTETVEDLRTTRKCPRCHYTIDPGWWHEEQPQPEGASHVVCSLRPAKGMILRGPLTDVLDRYLSGKALERALDPSDGGDCSPNAGTYAGLPGRSTDVKNNRIAGGGHDHD